MGKRGSTANEKLYARVSAREIFATTPTFYWTHLLFQLFVDFKLTLSITLCICTCASTKIIISKYPVIYGIHENLVLISQNKW